MNVLLRGLLLVCAGYVGIGFGEVAAHVDLISPDGGERLVAGETFTIEWTPAVAIHDTLNWDLWYSVIDAEGESWLSIADDLPVGDQTLGSSHSYEWSVPIISDSSVWVRVVQDNDLDNDWDDISSGSFSIVLEGDFDGSGSVDEADYTVWLSALGGPESAITDAGDGQSGVDKADYQLWKNNFGLSSGAGTVSAVPEPTSGVLLEFSGLGLVLNWRQRNH